MPALRTIAGDMLSKAARLVAQEEVLSRKTGRSFNIFEVLGLYSRENSHSLVLAELLRPSGTHGQGSAFLDLFLDCLRKCDLRATNGEPLEADSLNFDSSKAWVATESHIGPKTKDTGGRLDILIQADGRKIIIENKIYARLQENQLERYLNFPKKEGLVFFLTLNVDDSPICEASNLFRISYEKEICTWLSSCQRYATSLPYLRETISQYLDLVYKLTNQSSNNQMEHELAELIFESKDHYHAYRALTRCDSGIFNRLNKKLFEIGEAISREVPVTHGSQPITQHKRYQGLSFWREGWDNLGVGIQFSDTNYRNLLYGIHYRSERKGILPDDPIAKKLNESFHEKFAGSEAPSSWWPASKYYDNEWLNWGEDAFSDVLFSDPKSGELGNFGRDLLTKVKTMIDLVDGVTHSR